MEIERAFGTHVAQMNVLACELAHLWLKHASNAGSQDRVCELSDPAGRGLVQKRQGSEPHFSRCFAAPAPNVSMLKGYEPSTLPPCEFYVRSQGTKTNLLEFCYCEFIKTSKVLGYLRIYFCTCWAVSS